MDRIRIVGGSPLNGTIAISGAKNAALPLMIAGLRLASVSTIGLVTISGILGQSFGGLGFFIFERPTFATEILVGAVGSIALALGADVALGALQRRLTPWARILASDAP